MAITYKFSAVKGVQAKREYYIAMLPLGSLSRTKVNISHLNLERNDVSMKREYLKFVTIF